MPLLLFGSIYAALTLAVVAMVQHEREAAQPTHSRLARWLWTAAWFLYLVHVAVALGVVHRGHAAAYEHTARRTAELFGIETGVGLYVNYMFTIWWTLDVYRSWRDPPPVAPSRQQIAFEIALAFMTVNGAVIFAQGWTRVWGVVLCAVIGGVWWRRARRC
ncbi:MAG: hypothetical protein JNM18_27395 [Planctomycetaceae bacterium]|nr:hypothetical protein [Planctomycetaceae bacterium]